MLFNSYIFILCFLPLTLLLYFLLGRLRLKTWQKLELLAASLVFYGYFNPWYLFIISGSILINYFFSRLLLEQRIGIVWKKPFLAFAILCNLGLLFYYKYFDFCIANVNALCGTDFVLHNIVMPLGISFFTFQQLSYVVDSYRGETGAYSILDYAVFVSFFPQLVAGPIVLHRQIIPQFQQEENLHPRYDNLAQGLYVFAIGLFKKVIVADTLAKAVTWGFGDAAAMSSLDALIVTFAYTFQIYFDFSGYCDMAAGAARMFNICLPINFNSPYKALSIVDFWERWHISLTSFLREYLYFPLGGSRKGTARKYLNIFIVFLASGIWHGANWTFFAWGALHGVMSILTRLCQKSWNKLHAVLRWLLTFLAVNFSWLLFRADSIGQAFAIFKNIVAGGNFSLSPALQTSFTLTGVEAVRKLLPFTALGARVPWLDMCVFLLLCLIAVLALPNCGEIRFKPSAGRGVLTVLLLVWSILSLTGVSVFLYFNF